MNYDSWKTTNPDDQYLGPEPDEQREERELYSLLARINAANKIIAAQGPAIGSAHAALCNIRQFIHEHHLGACKIAGTTMAEYLDNNIRELV